MLGAALCRARNTVQRTLSHIAFSLSTGVRPFQSGMDFTRAEKRPRSPLVTKVLSVKQSQRGAKALTREIVNFLFIFGYIFI